MCHLVKKELCSFARKPWLFLLFFLGLVLGFFSILVYYAVSTHLLQMSNTILGQNKMVVFYAYDNIAADVASLVDSECLPKIELASCISYSNPDYDIVGLLYDEQTEASGVGELVSAKWADQLVCTVSEDIREDGIALDDMLWVNGVRLRVVGKMFRGGYTPSDYDLRRIPSGSALVAGYDLDDSNFITNRPNKAVIVPFDIIPRLNTVPEQYTLRFYENLSELDRREIMNTIESAVGSVDFEDIDKYTQVVSTNHINELIIYIAGVLVGMVNIFALYSIILKQNQRQYVIYRVLGADDGRLFRLIVCSFSLVTLTAYMLSCICADIFLKNTELIGVHQPFTVFTYISIFAVILIVVILICNGASRSIFRKKERTGKKNDFYESDYTSIHVRFLYLLSCIYSKKYIVRILSIAFLSGICALVVSFASVFILDSSKYDRYTKKAFPVETGVLGYNSALEMDARVYADQYNKDLPQYKRLINKIYELDGLTGVGMVYDPAYIFMPDDSLTAIRMVNTDFATKSPVPLYKGSWEMLVEYDKSNEDAPVPCIVPYEARGEFPIGYTFERTVNFVTGKKDFKHEDGLVSVKSKMLRHTRRFVVVGIAAKDAYRIREGNVYTDDIGKEITKIIELNNDMGLEFYTPIIQFQNIQFFQSDPMKIFLYTDRENNCVAAWNEELKPYGGGVWDIDECVQFTQKLYRLGGGNTYYLHAIIGGLLLLFGITGYSYFLFYDQKKSLKIYYCCGMKWFQAVLLIAVNNFINIIFTSVIGSALGVYIVSRTREFDDYSLNMAFFVGFFAIFVLYFIVNLIIGYSIQRKKPTQLEIVS